MKDHFSDSVHHPNLHAMTNPQALSTADRSDAGVTRLPLTPALLLGPFYPVPTPADATAALWHGTQPPAGARRLRLTGRLLDTAARALPAACVELWHADPSGRYPHPAAPQHEAVDASFSGYGRVISDSDGRFEFHSLVPGGYQNADARRAPHLHLQITTRAQRLVTQLFLPQHPANAGDRWFNAARQPELLTAEVLADGPSALHLTWTAVLMLG